MKILSEKELLKWFNSERGNYCPYCKYYLDWQCNNVSEKNNPTTDYTDFCRCDDNRDLMWMVTVDNINGKVITVQRVC